VIKLEYEVTEINKSWVAVCITEQSSIAFDSFESSNGWTISSAHSPACAVSRKSILLRGSDTTKDDDVLLIPLDIFHEVEQALNEFKEAHISDGIYNPVAMLYAGFQFSNGAVNYYMDNNGKLKFDYPDAEGCDVDVNRLMDESEHLDITEWPENPTPRQTLLGLACGYAVRGHDFSLELVEDAIAFETSYSQGSHSLKRAEIVNPATNDENCKMGKINDDTKLLRG